MHTKCKVQILRVEQLLLLCEVTNDCRQGGAKVTTQGGDRSLMVIACSLVPKHYLRLSLSEYLPPVSSFAINDTATDLKSKVVIYAKKTLPHCWKSFVTVGGASTLSLCLSYNNYGHATS